MTTNSIGVSYPRNWVLGMTPAEAHKADKDLQRQRRDLRRNPQLVFQDGDEIRHVIKESPTNERSVWKTKVQKGGDGNISFLFHDLTVPRISSFAQSHYKQIRPENTEGGRTFHCNAWNECEIFREDEWQSMEFLDLVPHRS